MKFTLKAYNYITKYYIFEPNIFNFSFCSFSDIKDSKKILLLNIEFVCKDGFLLIENPKKLIILKESVFYNFTLQHYFIKIISNNAPNEIPLFEMKNVLMKFIDKPATPNLIYFEEGYHGNVSFINTVCKIINTGLVEGFFNVFQMENSFLEIIDHTLSTKITTPLFHPKKFDYFNLKSSKFAGSSAINSGSVNYPDK